MTKANVGADATGRDRVAIITTEANELMEPVHNRMPVILAPGDYTRWLTRDPGDTYGMGHGELPLDLLRPYDAEAMKAASCFASWESEATCCAEC